MPVRKKPVASKKRASASLIIGTERFIQISAVEGIKPTPAMKRRMVEFEELGLTAAERRKQIIKAHSKG